ncbi:MAG: lysophospholipid acyltransferase family protein [Magnetovibrionaceae bacterium]
MRAFFKKLGKSEALKGLIRWAVARYVLFCYATSRWRVEGGEHPQAFWDAARPFILTFWHNRLGMMVITWPRKGPSARPITMMVSAHRDGRLIAESMAPLGIKNAEGSSTRGGAAAMRVMLKLIKNGECVGLTPDGPKGPRMVAQEGAAALAKLSGVPVIPCAYGIKRRKLLRSWDRFIWPYPFNAGITVWGPPIHVGRDENTEAATAKIEIALMDVTNRADAAFGLPPIQMQDQWSKQTDKKDQPQAS